MVQQFEKTVLSGGLRVLSEYIPSVRSVSLGIWVQSGTRFEPPEQNGIAHFLEHMMFKGTKRRTARQIARSIETLGGNINAFTAKEQTCYYVEVLDEHLVKAVDVLADMLCQSRFPPREIEKERQVILDEILSLEDAPDELIQEQFVEYLFPDHGLGRPIMGTAPTVRRITRESLLEFYHAFYRAPNILITAAGNVDHHRLCRLCEERFQFDGTPAQLPPESPGLPRQGEFRIKKSVNQAHICAGGRAYPFGHPRQYDLLVLNTILGGGMGSRLFQNIRERHGLAYSIYSFLDFFSDAGFWGVYLGTDGGNLSRALTLLEREFEKLREKGVSQKEVQEARSQLKGNLVLALESTARRMNRLAIMEIYLGRLYTIDEVIERINQVSVASIREVIEDVFAPERILRIIYQPD
ncbi:MAG: insulinase family protein [Calditrichaeota bacterium]|nr:MAG: insulinase family protein [Calditrichota bacterium]